MKTREKPEGQEHRVIAAARVERPKQRALRPESQSPDQEGREEEAEPEVVRQRHQGEGQACAEHVEAPVGKIHHAEQPEDQRQTERQQHIDHAQRDADNRLADDHHEGHVKHCHPHLPPARPARGGRRPSRPALFGTGPFHRLVGLDGGDDFEESPLPFILPGVPGLHDQLILEGFVVTGPPMLLPFIVVVSGVGAQRVGHRLRVQRFRQLDSPHDFQDGAVAVSPVNIGRLSILGPIGFHIVLGRWELVLDPQ